MFDGAFYLKFINVTQKLILCAPPYGIPGSRYLPRVTINILCVLGATPGDSTFKRTRVPRAPHRPGILICFATKDTGYWNIISSPGSRSEGDQVRSGATPICLVIEVVRACPRRSDEVISRNIVDSSNVIEYEIYRWTCCKFGFPSLFPIVN